VINETIKRLIHPNGPGYRIMSALLTLEESGNRRPVSVPIEELVEITGLADGDIRGLVDEMVSVELLRTADEHVWLCSLGHIWMRLLQQERQLGVADHLDVPVAGVAHRGTGRKATISLTFTEGGMWSLIDMVGWALAASGPADRERLSAMKIALERHHEQLLLVAEGDSEPGDYSIRCESTGRWFELPRSRGQSC